MLYKEDWSQVCERFKAWWENELFDRPIIQVTAPRKGVRNLPECENLGFAGDPYRPEDYLSYLSWVIPLGFARDPYHPEVTVNKFEDWCSKVFFGGEAYPDLWINLGPGIAATYIGAEARYREDSKSVWFETPKEWQELEGLKFDPDNKWWQLTKNITSFVSDRSEGKFLAGITDLGGITDIAASLRGSQNLIIDMFKRPEKVKTLSSQILELWHIYYEELYKISKGETRGNSAWMGLWAPKRWYPIQCDLSAMLSPKLFKEFALPYIKEQCLRLDYTIYHLDGPGEIPHLDFLLSIPELSGIQWVPGAGNPPIDSPEWFHLYKKIQKSGKLLVLQGVSKDNVKSLLRELNPKGLLISTYCSTEKEARNLRELPMADLT